MSQNFGQHLFLRSFDLFLVMQICKLNRSPETGVYLLSALLTKDQAPSTHAVARATSAAGEFALFDD
jgi:hypothetical protein